MLLHGVHDVVIVSERRNDGRILLASIVNIMVLNAVRRKNRKVLMSIRETGSELLDGAENIAEIFRSVHRANAYSLVAALQNAEDISDSLELTLEADHQFCGKIRFRCFSEQQNVKSYTGNMDTVLAIVDENAGAFLEKTLPRLLTSAETGLSFALKCGEKPEDDSDPREHLLEHYPALKKLSDRHCCAFGWYNPYGYIGGQQRSPENPYPYGIDLLFWETMRVSAQVRQQFLQKSIQESMRTMRRRRGVFQKDSIRRCMELDRARLNYAHAIRGLYAARQLAALTEGLPLTERTEPIKE